MRAARGEDQAIVRLAGKVALITGGAGSIGLATARAFVAEGAKVVIVDLDEAELKRAAEPDPDTMGWAVGDVTSSEQVKAAVDLAVQRFGRLDIAFANAGLFGVVAPTTDYPVDVFERVMAVNVLGSFLVAKHALAVMEKGGEPDHQLERGGRDL